MTTTRRKTTKYSSFLPEERLPNWIKPSIGNVTQLEKVQSELGDMMHNKVNITRLQKDVEKIITDVEKLKDGQRGLLNGGRNHK